MPSSKNKVFLDANVIISAVLSRGGGSFRLITESNEKGFNLFSCPYALNEVVKNLQEKYPGYLKNFKSILLLTHLRILTNASQRATENAVKLIDFKDAPILASAIKHKMNFLITLDREHFFTNYLKQAQLPFEILIPGDFIQKYF